MKLLTSRLTVEDQLLACIMWGCDRLRN